MAADQGIVDSVSNVNVKNLGDAAPFAMGRLYNVAVDGYAELGMISRAAAASAVRSLVQVDPIEAVSTGKVLTGNDLAAQIAQLIAALSSAQQGVKAAVTTPPTTI